MNPKIVGMDFGTTNSGMSIYSDGRDAVEILPLDPNSPNPRVARTAVYLTNDQQITIGRSAIETYMEQNTGRPVRMEKVWVGEIEVRAEDMYYVTDVFVVTDVLSPGRLFLSIKTGLRDPDYLGTVIGQFYYSLEDLIALFLSVTRLRAEKMLGFPLKQVVLGRPVRFAFDPRADQLAQKRLLDAALRAGYETVYFQYEPVAAAYAYAQTIRDRHHILVFDFGGGTLDVTIMAVGEDKPEILATGGIPVAGDVFDRKITRAKLPRHFGEGSHYQLERQTRPVPSWIFDIFSDWQRILELQAPDHKEMLAEIAQTAHRPREIEMLIHLVSENYGLQMFDAVEQAKRRLSDDLGTLIHFAAGPIRIRQMITRAEFEVIIREEIEAIEVHLDELLAQAGLTHADIQAVVRTGGSAEIPVFQELLKSKFGDDRVLGIDPFSSVTAGLGICAREVAAGRLDLRPFTTRDLARHSVEKKSNVSSANLALLQQRIRLQEGQAGAPEKGRRQLAILTGGLDFRLIDWPPAAVYQHDSPLPAAAAPMVAADLDETLLAITNLYRFLLFSPRQLGELQALGMTLSDLHHFRPLEQIEMIASWDQMTTREWLALITSRGMARAYRLEQLREQVESPAPFQFDHPLPGVVVAALGVNTDDIMVLANEDSRLLRLPADHSKLQLRGLQALSWREGERIFTGQIIASGATLLLGSPDGFGKTLAAVDLPLVDKRALRPPVQSSRKPLVFLMPVDLTRPTGWLVTSERIVPLPANLPQPDLSRRTTKLVQLKKGEKIIGAIKE